MFTPVATALRLPTSTAPYTSLKFQGYKSNNNQYEFKLPISAAQGMSAIDTKSLSEHIQAICKGRQDSPSEPYEVIIQTPRTNRLVTEDIVKNIISPNAINDQIYLPFQTALGDTCRIEIKPSQEGRVAHYIIQPINKQAAAPKKSLTEQQRTTLKEQKEYQKQMQQHNTEQPLTYDLAKGTSLSQQLGSPPPIPLATRPKNRNQTFPPPTHSKSPYTWQKTEFPEVLPEGKSSMQPLANRSQMGYQSVLQTYKPQTTYTPTPKTHNLNSTYLAFSTAVSPPTHSESPYTGQKTEFLDSNEVLSGKAPPSIHKQRLNRRVTEFTKMSWNKLKRLFTHCVRPT